MRFFRGIKWVRSGGLSSYYYATLPDPERNRRPVHPVVSAQPLVGGPRSEVVPYQSPQIVKWTCKDLLTYPHGDMVEPLRSILIDAAVSMLQV